MAIKITVSNKVGFTVKGELNDENGNSQPFDFTLTAHRFTEDAMNETHAKVLVEIGRTGGHKPIADLLCGPEDDPEKALIVNWGGVKDDDGAPIAFSVQRLRDLLHAYRGMAALIWRTYQNDAGAKEKN